MWLLLQHQRQAAKTLLQRASSLCCPGKGRRGERCWQLVEEPPEEFWHHPGGPLLLHQHQRQAAKSLLQRASSLCCPGKWRRRERCWQLVGGASCGVFDTTQEGHYMSRLGPRGITTPDPPEGSGLFPSWHARHQGVLLRAASCTCHWRGLCNHRELDYASCQVLREKFGREVTMGDKYVEPRNLSWENSPRWLPRAAWSPHNGAQGRHQQRHVVREVWNGIWSPV